MFFTTPIKSNSSYSPFITKANGLSNLIVRGCGISSGGGHPTSHSAMVRAERIDVFKWFSILSINSASIDTQQEALQFLFTSFECLLLLDKLRISLRWYRCSGELVPRGAEAWYRSYRSDGTGTKRPLHTLSEGAMQTVLQGTLN